MPPSSSTITGSPSKSPAGAYVTDVRDQAAFLLGLGRTTAEVVPYRSRRGPAFLVNSPGCAALVLGDRELAYDGDPHPYRDLTAYYTRQAMLVLGIGGHQSTGAVREEVGRDLCVAATATAEGLVDLSEGEPVPVLGTLHELLLRSTARMLFGVDVTPSARTFVSAIRLLEECWANELGPDPSMQPLHQEYVHAVDAQKETVDSIAHAAAIAAPRAVILRTLLNGYHATATALTWALWELARHPDVQEASRAEVDAVCRGHAPTPADTRRLHLTRRIVLETLRLHPPAWNIGRTASRTHNLGGTCIPEGSYLSVSPYVMHRSRALWPQPDAFLPGRFVAEAEPRRAPGSFLPFGAGPHRCPAARHAIEQLQMLLAVFVQLTRFEPADVPVRPRGLIGLRPEPDVYLRIVRNG